MSIPNVEKEDREMEMYMRGCELQSWFWENRHIPEFLLQIIRPYLRSWIESHIDYFVITS